VQGRGSAAEWNGRGGRVTEQGDARELHGVTAFKREVFFPKVRRERRLGATADAYTFSDSDADT